MNKNIVQEMYGHKKAVGTASQYSTFAQRVKGKYIERFPLMRIAIIIAASITASTAQAQWDSDLREDGMTDERVVFAAENGTSNSSIAIQCQEGAEMIVVFRLPVSEKLRGRVTYRLDKEDSQTIPGFTLDGGVGVLGPDAKELIPKLLRGSELRAQGHQKGFAAEPTRVFMFGLAGSTAAFAKACSWHPDYDKLTS